MLPQHANNIEIIREMIKEINGENIKIKGNNTGSKKEIIKEIIKIRSQHVKKIRKIPGKAITFMMLVVSLVGGIWRVTFFAR